MPSFKVLALVLGVLLTSVSVLWPISIAIRSYSCDDLIVCFSTEAASVLGAMVSLSAYWAYRKNDLGKILAIKMGVLIVAPMGILLGIFTSLIFNGVSKDRVVDAAKSVLDFDGFLSIGWTIGFGLLGTWVKEVRDLRRTLVKAVRDDPELKREDSQEAKKTLDWSKELTRNVFGEAASAIVFFVISALFAITAILGEQSVYLLVSIAFSVLGVLATVLSWYDFFSKTEILRYALDTLDLPG